MMRNFFKAVCPLTRATRFSCFAASPGSARSVATNPAAARKAAHDAAAVSARFPSNQYNRVERIILVRHGQSLGNVDESTYVDTADWRIPLTHLGKQQACAAGDTIRELLERPVDGDVEPDDGSKVRRPGKIFFYVSPYRRTRQTLRGIMSRIDRDQIVGIREEPRISEQQFGNFQNIEAVQRAKSERREF